MRRFGEAFEGVLNDFLTFLAPDSVDDDDDDDDESEAVIPFCDVLVECIEANQERISDTARKNNELLEKLRART